MPKKDKDSTEKTEKKDRKAGPPGDAPIDLAARIGTRSPAPAELPPAEKPAPQQRLDGPLPARRGDRPSFIGMDEPRSVRPELARPEPPAGTRPGADASDATGEAPRKRPSGALESRRTAPGPGEIDVVVTPLATPDDWHQFEIAFRRVRGITQLRPEYYRHGVAKMRVMWEGEGRLAQTLRGGIQGFRVRVIGEDKGTLQILVSQDNEERRPS